MHYDDGWIDCPHCKQSRLAVSPGSEPSSTPHIVLTVITFGGWLLLVLLYATGSWIAVGSKRRCKLCGARELSGTASERLVGVAQGLMILLFGAISLGAIFAIVSLF